MASLYAEFLKEKGRQQCCSFKLVTTNKNECWQVSSLKPVCFFVSWMFFWITYMTWLPIFPISATIPDENKNHGVWFRKAAILSFYKVLVEKNPKWNKATWDDYYFYIQKLASLFQVTHNHNYKIIPLKTHQLSQQSRLNR